MSLLPPPKNNAFGKPPRGGFPKALRLRRRQEMFDLFLRRLRKINKDLLISENFKGKIEAVYGCCIGVERIDTSIN